MDEYLSIPKIVSLYGKKFYKKMSKNVPAILHKTLGVKLYEKAHIDIYKKEYFENEKVTIKDFCKLIKISREWYYQLLRKGIIPKPHKNTGGLRNWGYTKKESETFAQYIKLVRDKNKIFDELDL